MAQGDLNAIRGMVQPSLIADFFTDEVFGFHAQQAVEKTLKAWLSFKGVRYQHTHDLMALIDALEDASEDVGELLEFVDLNPFAVQYRYETLDEDEDPIDRKRVIEEVQKLFDFVSALIK